MTTVLEQRNSADRQTLTILEAAAEYGVNHKTIRRYIADGLLGSSQARPGAAIRIRRKEWERFLRTRQ